MDILTKRLKPGEVNWNGITLPRDKKGLFPAPGVVFDLHNGKDTYKVKVDSQFRIRLTEWYRDQLTVKPGDEVSFRKESGAMHIGVSSNSVGKTVSIKELIGRVTPEGKVRDVRQNSDGSMVAVIETVREMPLDEILARL